MIRWVRQRGWQPVTVLLGVGVALIALGVTQQIPGLHWLGLVLAVVGFVGLVIVWMKPTPLTAAEVEKAAALEFWSRPPVALGDESSPALPESIPGWRKLRDWHYTLRVFDDRAWVPVVQLDGSHFPSTQNGCDHQLFTLRWRLLADQSLVEAAEVDAISQVQQVVGGASGWMILDGCRHPAFRFIEEPRGSTMLDVTVEIGVWVPAV